MKKYYSRAHYDYHDSFLQMSPELVVDTTDYISLHDIIEKLSKDSLESLQSNLEYSEEISDDSEPNFEEFEFPQDLVDAQEAYFAAMDSYRNRMKSKDKSTDAANAEPPKAQAEASPKDES